MLTDLEKISLLNEQLTIRLSKLKIFSEIPLYVWVYLM